MQNLVMSDAVLIVATLIGGLLLLVGLTHAILPTRVRLPLNLVLGLVFTAVAAFIGTGVVPVMVAVIVMSAIETGLVAWVSQSLLRGHPVLWFGVSIAGVLLILGGSLHYDMVAEYDKKHLDPEGVAANRLKPIGRVQLDSGETIPVRAPRIARDAETLREAGRNYEHSLGLALSVIRRGNESDTTNCHGYTFLNSQGWLDGTSAAKILTGNGYQRTELPQAGDVAIYRNSQGAIAHSALVRVASDTGEVFVEGKWGALGVYLHEARNSPYGESIEYYRTTRGTHTLRALPTPVGSAGVPVPVGL